MQLKREKLRQYNMHPFLNGLLIKTQSRNYALGIPCYLFALVLAFWSPAVSVGICSILWLFWAFTTYERRPARGAYQKRGFEPNKKERHNEGGFDDGNMA